MPFDDKYGEEDLSARIHGQSGALKDYIALIGEPRIQSLEDALQFSKNSPIYRQQKIDESIASVKVRLVGLSVELVQSLSGQHGPKMLSPLRPRR